MANRSPHPGRIARNVRRRRRKAGDIAALRRSLWQIIDKLEVEISAARGFPARLIRHVHCLTQLSGVYIRACEVGELEARVTALEAERSEL